MIKLSFYELFLRLVQNYLIYVALTRLWKMVSPYLMELLAPEIEERSEESEMESENE